MKKERKIKEKMGRGGSLWG